MKDEYQYKYLMLKCGDDVALVWPRLGNLYVVVPEDRYTNYIDRIGELAELVRQKVANL